MQRRLIDDLIELEIHSECIQKSNIKIREILHRLLSAQNKSMEVLFNGSIYDFYYPVTQEEHHDLSLKRNELIEKIMTASFDTGNWDFVLAFASGPDPLEFQMEKIDVKDLYSVGDIEGRLVTSIPLNEDSHSVKTERLKD